MKEEERQRAIRMRLARAGLRPSAGIPTGFAALDAALGAGGLPRGRMVELFGPPSVGKTTLLLASIAHLQRAGAGAAWIDADRTFDPAWAAALGVEIERVPVAQPVSAEEALAIAQQLTESGALDLVVIDSAAALVPSLELEAGIGNQSRGLQGRVLASGLRRLSAAAARSGVAVVLLNQVRSRRDRSGEEFETSAGGTPLKLYAAVRIQMDPAGGGARLSRSETSWRREPRRLNWPGNRAGGSRKARKTAL